jgi:hypothetical protein
MGKSKNLEELTLQIASIPVCVWIDSWLLVDSAFGLD